MNSAICIIHLIVHIFPEVISLNFGTRRGMKASTHTHTHTFAPDTDERNV